MSSESTSPDLVEVAAGAAAAGEVVHRVMDDDSGQDYFVYRPRDIEPDAPLCVAIHDISRNARELAELFSESCDRYGAVLIVPHFAADQYPNYQRLGRSRNAKIQGRRADATLNAILDDAATLGGVAASRIHLFGFAAGGRFAMRFAMAHPDRVARVAIASAGTYTFPDPEKRFPRGIAPGPGHADIRFDPEQFLRVPMTVIEPGKEEATGNSRSLRRVGRSPRSAQERNGRNWVLAMQDAARQRRLESLTSYTEVEGPAHSLKAFVEQGALADHLFEALLGPSPDDSALAEESADAGLAEGDSSGRWEGMRRILLLLLASGALIALLAPVLLWAQYRSTHVISRDAVVRGHIADVGSRLEGVIESVEVDIGDSVRAGQIIARLRDDHFQARVRQASSELQKASRELEVEGLAIANERLRLDSSLNEVSAGSSAAGAELRAAESRAEETRRRLELQKSLSAQGLVAAEQVRTAETELRTARALVSAARAEARAAEAALQLARVEAEGLAVRQKRISVLESEIAAYQAELAVAEANLEGAVIRAPDDGAVLRRIIEPGGVTVVGQPMISIWIGEETWIEAWVDEDVLSDIEVGGEATVTFASYPDKEFIGVIETISVSTDFELPDSDVPQPRHERMRDAPVIAVRIRLVDPEEDFFPGLSAVVGIRKKDR